MLGRIVCQTYLNLRKLGFYYTDSNPANVFYHFLRPKDRKSDSLPFTVLLGDLGSMVNIREYREGGTRDDFFTRFAAQTYPYPTQRHGSDGKNHFVYDCKNFSRTHENRKEMLERVVIWGLGMLLLRMCLKKESHRRLFENTFSHDNLTRTKYEAFINFILVKHEGDREYLNHIPKIIKDIVSLRAPPTLEGVLQAIDDTMNHKSRQVPQIHRRKGGSNGGQVFKDGGSSSGPNGKKRSRQDTGTTEYKRFDKKNRRWEENSGVSTTKEMILDYEDTERKERSVPLRRKYNQKRTKNMAH